MVLNLQKTDIDWQYYAEKSDKASLSIPKGTYWPRGKVLGGSGAINALIYLRGNRKDYNSWEELGNHGWGWNDALHYFKKSEGNKIDHLQELHGGKFHSKEGPLSVDKYWSMDENMKYVIIDALQEKGHQEIYDFNGEEHIGWATVFGTIKKGERNSPASAFLTPIVDRPNLHVIKHAHVTKIDFEGDSNKVSGVKFLLNGKELTAKAKKETILSAGAVNTPQILMQSGIGPKEHLSSLGIPVKADLKVGHNLQDHVIVPYFVSCFRDNQQQLDPQQLGGILYSYFMHRMGPLAGLGTTDYIGFLNMDNSSSPFPDLQIHNFYFKQGVSHFPLFMSLIGYSEEMTESLMQKFEEGSILIYYLTLLKQEVPGRIELRSTDPRDPPKIFTNYLEDDSEVRRVTKGIRMLQQLKGTSTYKFAEAEEIHVKIGACDKLEYDSDEYWECYIRHTSTTLYHPVGTAKMGPDSDPDAVLDSELNVRGVEKLRVIDASVMPIIPSANTNAPTIMVGEKGSDLIKAAHQQKDTPAGGKDEL